MSRHHRKNLKRGIKQPLVEREQRVRASRHNAPHTHRRWFRAEEMVAPGTPGAKRSVEAYDPAENYPEGTVITGDIVVVHRKQVDRSKQVPISEPYKMRVADGKTGTHGMPNTGGEKAGKKSVKKEK
jgi:hypothetical protein